MAEFKLTRMELIGLKQRIKLAEKGHDLLKKKRDALITEFFKMLGKSENLREELDAIMASSYKKLAAAEAVDGTVEVTAASMAVHSTLHVDVKAKNIMGIKIPQVSYGGDIQRRYGMIGTSVRIDETSEEFSRATKLIVELAGYETAIKRLLDEIEKTKRRVNALEYIVLPRLKVGASYIRMRLDEMERDDFFRLKMVKKKLEKKGEGG